MEKKIKKWQLEGLIDEETASKLLVSVQADRERARKIKLNITIYTIAAFLIGIGVITFISANDWILALLNSSDLLKIFLMTSLTLLTFYGGYSLAYDKKILPRLGEGLIILSTLLIGGTYALIGQIYNFNANSSSLIFLWLLSILPVAYVFKNKAVNIMSIILFILGIIFLYEELALDISLIWTIFIPVLCGTLLYTIGNIPVVLEKYNDFSLSYKVTGIIPIFVTLMVLTCSVEHSYHITSPYYIVPIVVLMLANVLNYVCAKVPSNLLKLETFSIIFLLGALLLLLVLPSVSTPVVMITANAGLIGIISYGFNYGYKFENSSILGTTNQLLIVYLMVNYCRWGWSFMDKSLFFILGGTALLALGIFLEKRRKEIARAK